MRYGQDFVEKIYVLLISLGVIVVVYGVLQRGALMDTESGQEKRLCSISTLSKLMLCIICSEGMYILWRSMLNAGSYANSYINGTADIGWKLVLLCIFFACLLFAAVMDLETCMVYDYVWWIAGGAAIILLYRARPSREIIIELILFILLQELFFALMYGRADCHAFAACAILESGFGMGMQEYLVHMLLAFLFLTVLQLFKGNVGRFGNLKTPVAFLPYITIGCWLMFFIYTCKDFLYIYAKIVDFSL